MNELMPYLGWLLCGFINGVIVGVGSTVLFAVWFSRRGKKKEREAIMNNPQGVGGYPYDIPE